MQEPQKTLNKGNPETESPHPYHKQTSNQDLLSPPLTPNSPDLKDKKPQPCTAAGEGETNQKELEDGLKLMMSAMDEFVFKDPLAHEHLAHPEPQFQGRFDPVAFHLTETLLRQLNFDKPADQVEEKSERKPESQRMVDVMNKEALVERTEEWVKINSDEPDVYAVQQRNVETHVHDRERGKPMLIIATPNVPEILGYTNNLPVITKSRAQQKPSQQGGLLRKVGIAAMVSGLCLGACMLGKTEKKIATGVSVAGFAFGYLFQD